MSCESTTLEERLQEEWLKNNKPNTYFETVINRREDNLIGVGVSYVNEAKKVSDVVSKRRSTKDANGETVHHYFTVKGKVFLKEEILVMREH